MVKKCYEITVENEEEEEEKDYEKFNFDIKRLFYTFSVMINFMGYGMGNTMVGTSLIDLGYIYNVSEEKMSHAPLLIAIGYVCGALLSGQISTRLYDNRQILIAIFLIPMSLVNFFILFMPYELVLVLLFFYGNGFGTCDALLSVWIVELWPKHNSIILPLSVVLFGFGQVIAPIIMSPFVYGELKPNTTEIITPNDRISSLFIPYSICGSFQIIIPFLYVIFNFTNFKYVTSSKKKNNDKNNDKQLDARIVNNPFRKYHLIIAGIAVAAYGGCEQGWNAFGPTMFQHLGDNFIDASEASLLIAYFSIAFTLGLFITTFIAMKLTPDKIIFYQLLLIYLALFVLFFGYANKPLIYVGTILLGYGMAPLWAMKFAFIENHLKLTDQIASIYTVLFGCFAIMVPLILEQTAKQNARMLLIIMIIFMFLSGLSFVTVKIWLVLLKRKQINLNK